MLDDFATRRRFRRSPGFTVGAVIRSALAVGSTVAVLSGAVWRFCARCRWRTATVWSLPDLVDRGLGQETKARLPRRVREWRDQRYQTHTGRSDRRLSVRPDGRLGGEARGGRGRLAWILRSRRRGTVGGPHVLGADRHRR